ncbi:MAG: YkoF family thiamine/hydroxymethylpyrimidine-binding protein [Dehalococcoidia bacterium]
MSDLSAQVSLYPLGAEDLSPMIDEVIDIFRAHALLVETGPMSTLIAGDDGRLFEALREATWVANRSGKMVMVITLSNACAVAAPEPDVHLRKDTTMVDQQDAVAGEAAARAAVAEALGPVLADTFTLYLKTHNFHWNVTGPRFRELHLMFEEQYNELWLATDLVAERIRALGEHAPATYRQFLALTSIQEPNGVPDAGAMIEELLAGHEAVARTIRGAFAPAESADDQVTADLLTQRLQVHEKTAWMLRSLIE